MTAAFFARACAMSRAHCLIIAIFGSAQEGGGPSGSAKMSSSRAMLWRWASGRTLIFVNGMGVDISDSKQKAGKHRPASKAALRHVFRRS
jgi:hypothetical protein